MDLLQNDQNITRLQITNPKDLTIPQSASLLVRGGSFFEKGMIVGDTDTIVPGGVRFRGNHLQVKEFNGWVTLVGFNGTGTPNSIATFDENGNSLESSGVEIINQNMFNLISVQTEIVDSPPSQRLQLNSAGFPILLPGTSASPNQVLANDGSGNLFWSNNAATNEMTFNAPWIPNRLMNTTSTPGTVEMTPFAITGTGGITGINDIQIANAKISTTASTTTISTTSSDLSLAPPNGSNVVIGSAIWPSKSSIGSLNRYGILRGGALATSLEYFDLFPSSATTAWGSNKLIRSTTSTGQIEPSYVSVTGTGTSTALNAPTIQGTTITDGTLTIVGGNISTPNGITAGTVTANSITDGFVTITASTITGISNLSISGTMSANSLATTNNALVGGSLNVTNGAEVGSLRTPTVQSGAGQVFTLPTADGTAGNALVTNGSGTLGFASFPAVITGTTNITWQGPFSSGNIAGTISWTVIGGFAMVFISPIVDTYGAPSAFITNHISTPFPTAIIPSIQQTISMVVKEGLSAAGSILLNTDGTVVISIMGYEPTSGGVVSNKFVAPAPGTPNIGLEGTTIVYSL